MGPRYLDDDVRSSSHAPTGAAPQHDEQQDNQPGGICTVGDLAEALRMDPRSLATRMSDTGFDIDSPLGERAIHHHLLLGSEWLAGVDRRDAVASRATLAMVARHLGATLEETQELATDITGRPLPASGLVPARDLERVLLAARDVAADGADDPPPAYARSWRPAPGVVSPCGDPAATARRRQRFGPWVVDDCWCGRTHHLPGPPASADGRPADARRPVASPADDPAPGPDRAPRAQATTTTLADDRARVPWTPPRPDAAPAAPSYPRGVIVPQAPAPGSATGEGGQAVTRVADMAQELDVTGHAVRTALGRLCQPSESPLPPRAVERLRLMGAAWVAAASDGRMGATTCAGTVGQFLDHLGCSHQQLAAVSTRWLGRTLPGRADRADADLMETLIHLHEHGAPRDRDRVLWRPHALPAVVDAMVEARRTLTNMGQRRALTMLDEADLVWVPEKARRVVTGRARPTGSIADTIPSPEGVLAFERPVVIPGTEQSDNRPVIAITWSFDETTDTVALRAWHRPARDTHRGNRAERRAAADPDHVVIGEVWDPAPAHVVRLDTTWKTAVRAAGRHSAVLEHTARLWECIQHGPTGSRPQGGTGTGVRDRRKRSVDVVAWSTQAGGLHASHRSSARGSYRATWWVRGHWRMQPVGAGRQERRRVWVSRHQRGQGADPTRRLVLRLTI